MTNRHFSDRQQEENKYFCFKVKDLIELIGFESSSSFYNIDENLEHFIQNFSYEAPQVILEQEKKRWGCKIQNFKRFIKLSFYGSNDNLSNRLPPPIFP